MNGISFQQGLPQALKPDPNNPVNSNQYLKQLADRLAPQTGFQRINFSLAAGGQTNDSTALSINGLIIQVYTGTVVVTLNNAYSYTFNATNPYNLFFPSMDLTQVNISAPSTNTVTASGALDLLQY